MGDELWREIDIEGWRSVPCTSGRVASEADTKVGRAVFYLGNPDEIRAESFDVSLPHCAILTNEEFPEGVPVIVIQAEQAEGKVYVGYRFFGGGNGMCTLPEIELVDEPDARFVETRNSHAY